MSIVKNQSASKTNKTASFSQHFEVLESRQLMSASLSHAAAPQPLEVRNDLHIHADKGHGVVTPTVNVVKTTIVAKPISTVPIHLPTLFVEPKVDSSVTHWQNFSSDPLFAPGGPSPRDVVQNQAADCWFLATLAEVAKNDPSVIENSIHQLADGTYDVLFHTSPTTTVVEHVDGLLPETSYGGLEYAQLGQDNCTWVAIMEKALTYFRNRSIPANYATINYGSGYEAYTDLGGTPSEVLGKVSNASELCTDVLWGLILGTSMDFGTNSSSGPLVNDHEYSVISERVEGGVEQIELRNPWGFNPGYVKGSSNYDSTNDGYLWVNASSVLPELDEFVSCGI